MCKWTGTSLAHCNQSDLSLIAASVGLEGLGQWKGRRLPSLCAVQAAPSTVPLANNASGRSWLWWEVPLTVTVTFKLLHQLPAGFRGVSSEISASSDSGFIPNVAAVPGTVVHNQIWLWWQFGGVSGCSGRCLALSPSAEQQNRSKGCGVGVPNVLLSGDDPGC